MHNTQMKTTRIIFFGNSIYSLESCNAYHAAFDDQLLLPAVSSSPIAFTVDPLLLLSVSHSYGPLCSFPFERIRLILSTCSWEIIRQDIVFNDYCNECSTHRCMAWSILRNNPWSVFDVTKIVSTHLCTSDLYHPADSKFQIQVMLNISREEGTAQAFK